MFFRLMPAVALVFALILILAACAGALPVAAPPDVLTGDEQAAATATPTSAAPSPGLAHTRDYGPAPEIDTDVWLNSEIPLRLADLRGKVVLVDFWTFG